MLCFPELTYRHFWQILMFLRKKDSGRGCCPKLRKKGKGDDFTTAGNNVFFGNQESKMVLQGYFRHVVGAFEGAKGHGGRSQGIRFFQRSVLCLLKEEIITGDNTSPA